jgi:hypothetical protein
MINGVLVERTVKEVVPALKTNSEGLKKVLDELVVQYKAKQDEMEKWKVSITVAVYRVLCHMGSLFTNTYSFSTEKEQYPGCAAVSMDKSSPSLHTKYTCASNICRCKSRYSSLRHMGNALGT